MTDRTTRAPSAPGSPSPQDQHEGLRSLEALVTELGHHGGDLVSMTRRARFAYEQLGLTGGADFLSRELAGYDPAEELPAYRRVGARRVWKTANDWARLRNSQTPDPRLAGGADTFHLRGSLASIAQYAATGFSLQTGQSQEVPFTSMGVTELVTWWEEIHIDEHAMQISLEHYRDSLHHGIGQAVITMHAARGAAPLWDVLRTSGDQLVAAAGVGNDLRSITEAALSPDPSAWEGGLLRCRNVIDKLSEHLYRVPGDTYPYLPDREGKAIVVSGNRYKNRLIAYLHQKCLNHDDRALLDVHIEWFWRYESEVNDLASKGKRAVSQRDVANGLFHTYLLISELAARTDGEPITSLLGP